MAGRPCPSIVAGGRNGYRELDPQHRKHILWILRFSWLGGRDAHLHNSSLLAVSAGAISSGPKPYLARMARCSSEPRNRASSALNRAMKALSARRNENAPKPA